MYQIRCSKINFLSIGPLKTGVLVKKSFEPLRAENKFQRIENKNILLNANKLQGNRGGFNWMRNVISSGTVQLGDSQLHNCDC